MFLSTYTNAHAVPEAATIVMQAGIVPQRGLRSFQQAVFGVQHALERAAILQSSHDVVLCDRGTLDGAAFMGGWADAVQANWLDELNRYAKVILLTLPSADVWEANRESNELRHHSYEESLALQMRLHEIWAVHDNYVRVEENRDWATKFAAVAHEVECV